MHVANETTVKNGMSLCDSPGIEPVGDNSNCLCPSTPHDPDEIMTARSAGDTFVMPRSAVAENLMNLTSTVARYFNGAAQNMTANDDEILASRSGSMPFDEILYSRSPDEGQPVANTSDASDPVEP